MDGTAIIREARSVKTPLEIELFRRSAALHARAYSKIPDVYHPGMTDRELSVEVERLMRLEGCLEYSEYLVRVWRYLWEVCWPEIMQLLLRLMILP